MEKIEARGAANDNGKWLVNVDSKGPRIGQNSKRADNLPKLQKGPSMGQNSKKGPTTGQNSKRGRQRARINNEPNFKRSRRQAKIQKGGRQRAKADNKPNLKKSPQWASADKGQNIKRANLGQKIKRKLAHLGGYQIGAPNLTGMSHV